MNVGILIAVSVIMACMNLAYMQWYHNQKERTYHGAEQFIKPLTPHRVILFCIMLIAMVGLSIYTVHFNDSVKLPFLLKRAGCMAILWPAAAVDYKEQKIPNKVILMGLIYRLLILIVEIIGYREQLLATVVSEVLSAFIIMVFCFLCRLIVKNGICMGDIKLMMCMGLFLGVYDLLNALFASFVVCFFMALYVLITKKKTKKDAIAMAPSILAGTLIAFILVVY